MQHVSNNTCYVQLGRIGDIINILPILYQQFRETGNKQNLLIAKDYFTLLEGCSYIDPIVFEGDFANLQGAIQFARPRFSNFKITQVYAHGMCIPPKTDCFLKESWERIGMGYLWGSLTPLFDRRDFGREKKLRDQFFTQKPAILVSSFGISSPFTHSQALLSLLKSELSAIYDVIDISNIRAHRFYDLLGLFDHAHCLITIDTAHMHLAPASKVPTIALCTDGPTPWHTSAQLRGQILRIQYKDFPSRQTEIISAIRNLRVSSSTSQPTLHSRPGQESPRLIHLYNDREREGDSLWRHNFAKGTWNNEYGRGNWQPWPIPQKRLPRSSANFGDTRSMPFIKDLVMDAIIGANAGLDDILVLTNDDICFVSGITQYLREVSGLKAAWSNRWDFPRLTRPLTTMECRTGCWCVGTDLFAFTPRWWNKFSAQFPDMVLGCEAWDWVMRDLIRDNGGFEVHSMTYHQFHPSYWQSGHNRYTNPGNKHNQRLAKMWLVERGKALRELAAV